MVAYEGLGIREIVLVNPGYSLPPVRVNPLARITKITLPPKTLSFVF